MAIESVVPTVIPAAAEKRFDKWWVSQFHVAAHDPNLPVHTTVVFHKMCVTADGAELMEEGKRFEIQDLMKLAQENPAVGQMVDQLLNLVATLAREAKVIDYVAPVEEVQEISPPVAEEVVEEPAGPTEDDEPVVA